MKILENLTFEPFYDRNSKAVFSDIEFRKCHFMSGALSVTLDPKLRSTVRNVNVINCRTTAASLWAAIVEDVVIDGLQTSRLFRTSGAVFKHVVLEGKIGRIMMSPAVHPSKITKEQQEAFNDANTQYYKSVDWALDISQAAFVECDIRCVPASLIRRDPETQAVVTRAKAISGEWQRLDLSNTYWPSTISHFLERGDHDIVLVAAKRNSKFKDLLNGLKKLREAGIAEPN
jgi:hypothetical protein